MSDSRHAPTSANTIPDDEARPQRPGLSQLPNPQSVDASNLQLPPTSKQAVKKVLAVISYPAHPLFNRCAHLLAFGTHPAVRSALSDPQTKAAVAAGILALPHGLSSRQASIAASFLTTILWSAVGPYGPGRSRPTNVRVDDPEAVIRQVIQHGIACKDAAGALQPAEVDGQECRQSVSRRLLWVEGGGGGAEVQPWLSCPRFLTLAHCCVLGDLLPPKLLLVQVVARAGMGALLLQQELVDSLMRAVLEGPLGVSRELLQSLSQAAVLPVANVTTLARLLERSPLLETLLKRLPARWLEHIRSTTNTFQESVALDWGCQVAQAYILVFKLSKRQGQQSLPAHWFIPSFVALLLDILEGPAFLLPPQTDTSTPDSAAPDAGHLPGHKQQQQQQQRRVRPAVAALADRCRDKLYDLTHDRKPFGQLFFDTLRDMLPIRAVLEHVVDSGLGLRMFSMGMPCRTKQQGRPEGSLQAALAFVDLMNSLDRARRAAAEGWGELLVAKLARQVYAKLDADPALLQATLVNGCGGIPLTNMRHKDLLANMMITLNLPPGARSPAARRILTEVLLPALRTLRSGSMTLRGKIWHLLAAHDTAVQLLWESGQEAVALVLEAALQELRHGCCRELLDSTPAPSPAFALVAAVGVLASPRCQLPKAEVMAAQKEALWRIGEMLEATAPFCDGTSEYGWHPAVSELEVWQHVSEVTEHRLSGQQLQQLVATMRQQGYRSSPVRWLETYTADTGGALALLRQDCTAICGICSAALCRLLAHAATADPAALPYDPKPQLLAFSRAAAKVATALVTSPYMYCYPSGVVLVSCLLTWADAAGGRWPCAGEVWGAEAASAARGVRRLLPEHRHRWILKATVVAWVAAVLRGQTLKAAWPLLSEAGLWQQVVELAASGEEGGLGSSMARALLDGVDTCLRQCGITPPADLGNAPRSYAGEPVALLAMCTMPLMGLGPERISGVRWEEALPTVWEGVDDVVRREWWGMVDRWIWEDYGEDYGKHGGAPGSGSSSTAGAGGSAGGVGASGVRVAAAAGKPGQATPHNSSSRSRSGHGGAMTSRQAQDAACEAGPSDADGGSTSSRASGGSEGMQPRSVAAAGAGQAPQAATGQAPQAAEVWQCTACGSRSEQLHLCSGCQSVRYCGARCQRAHWKQHKQACKALQAANGH